MARIEIKIWCFDCGDTECEGTERLWLEGLSKHKLMIATGSAFQALVPDTIIEVMGRCSYKSPSDESDSLPADGSVS